MENMGINFTQQTILVTGGTGFIGSHLVEALKKRNHKIIATDISRDPRSYFFQQKLDSSVLFEQGDIRFLDVGH